MPNTDNKTSNSQTYFDFLPDADHGTASLSKSEYVEQMIEWSDTPNSFCFESYQNLINDIDSKYIILSISNLNEMSRNLTISQEFIFYLRLSRILFGNKYGYKYCEFGETFDISKSPHFSKWNAIRILSTLKNAEHILWIDVDAIFHSKTVSIEKSPFYKYVNSKLFVFTLSKQSNNAINSGLFLTNTKVQTAYNATTSWTALDVLDWFSFIEHKYEIKSYWPTHEQVIFRVLKREYEQEFRSCCAVIEHNKKAQFTHYVSSPSDYEYFVWHWTGIPDRYMKMIPVMKKEVGLFLEDESFIFNQDDNVLGILEAYVKEHKLESVFIPSAKKHIFEPEWIKNSLICESKWWPKKKAEQVLGRLYSKSEISGLCSMPSVFA